MNYGGGGGVGCGSGYAGNDGGDGGSGCDSDGCGGGGGCGDKMNLFVHLPVMSVDPGGDMGCTGRETVHLVDRGAGGQGAGGLGEVHWWWGYLLGIGERVGTGGR